MFFDILGLYFISYTESTGIILNYAVAAISLILVFVSIWRTSSISSVSLGNVLCWFILILVLQIIAFVLGLGLPVAIGYLFDMYGLSMTYFSTPALMIGLYICPSLLGLSLPSYIYLRLRKNVSGEYEIPGNGVTKVLFFHSCRARWPLPNSSSWCSMDTPLCWLFSELASPTTACEAPTLSPGLSSSTSSPWLSIC